MECRDGASWYDAGIRLSTEAAAPAEPAAAPAVQEPAEPDAPKAKLTASAEASIAAAGLSALAVLGFDAASFGVIENLDLAVLASGIALSQVDSEGPVGDSLRLAGNATAFVATEVVAPTASGVYNFWEKNELGYKSRALLEIGIENAIYAFDPERREREQAEAAAIQAAEEAAILAEEERLRKEALPWYSLEKYS